MSPEYIQYGLPYKKLIALRESRIKRLIKEQKEMENDVKRQQSQNIRDEILRQ